jgi:hypothetical protein
MSSRQFIDQELSMATYYEILKVPPTATTAEIEAALGIHYNHWRRLVTHHDPAVVNQANQALQALEMIRATLTDPEKRTVYDAAIGVNGPVGGLADPTVLLQPATPVPPPPIAVKTQSPPPPAITEQADAWVCPKCQRANAPGTPFCKQCGQKLGRKCPKCGKLTEALFSFCAFCGVDMDVFLREKQMQAQQAVDKSLARISNLIRQIQQTKSTRDLQEIEKLVVSIGEDVKQRLSELPENAAEPYRRRLLQLMTEAENTLIQRGRHRSLFDRWLRG